MEDWIYKLQDKTVEIYYKKPRDLRIDAWRDNSYKLTSLMGVVLGVGSGSVAIREFETNSIHILPLIGITYLKQLEV